MREASVRPLLPDQARFTLQFTILSIEAHHQGNGQSGVCTDFAFYYLGVVTQPYHDALYAGKAAAASNLDIVDPSATRLKDLFAYLELNPVVMNVPPGREDSGGDVIRGGRIPETGCDLHQELARG